MPGIFKLLSIALFTGAVLPSCSPGTKPVKESYSGVLPEIKAPARLSYAGTGYQAGYSAVTTEGLLVEYFKSGETPSNWSSMVALRTFDNAGPPAKVAAATAMMVHRQGLPVRAVEIPKSSDASADFFVKGKRGWEFNAFRFAPQPGSAGVKSFQYAEMVPYTEMKAADFKSLTGKHRALILGKPVPSISR